MVAIKEKKTLWHNILAGVLIGIGCVLPGVSGGVMAVSFGLYRPMLDAVLGFFHAPKKSIKFLYPLAIGGAIGFLIGAKGLSLAMASYETEMLFVFIGFIAGGIPDLLREADQGKSFHPRNLWALALGIALALPLIWLPQGPVSVTSLTPAQALLSGAIEGVGTIIPGLSSSFVLLCLGWYQAFLAAVATFQVATLVFIALGFAAAALLCMKGIKWLFDYAQAAAYYGVLGFLLVSVALVLPSFEAGRGLWLNLLMLILGLLGAMWMSRLGQHETSHV